MRVTVSTFEEFQVCLANESQIFADTIRFSKSLNPVDNSDRNKATKFRVDIYFSTVVLVEGGTEYILEGGETCGFDYHDKSKSQEGSDIAHQKYIALKEYAGTRQWRVLPGVIHP